MFQIEAALEIAKHAKKENLNVWCYTGFTYEELRKKVERDPYLEELLNNIDVLVDGKFIESKKSLDIPFRGSTNQRIIDIKESMQKSQRIEIKEYKEEPDQKNTYGRDNFIFV